MSTTSKPFRDRKHAGQVLAKRLEAYRGQKGVVILGLPRGGVVVADEMARALDAPLDTIMAKKNRRPGQSGAGHRGRVGRRGCGLG